jgi:gas vesicle protein
MIALGFYGGLIIGLFIGSFIGIFVAGLLAAAGRGEHDRRR